MCHVTNREFVGSFSCHWFVRVLIFSRKTLRGRPGSVFIHSGKFHGLKIWLEAVQWTVEKCEYFMYLVEILSPLYGTKSYITRHYVVRFYEMSTPFNFSECEHCVTSRDPKSYSSLLRPCKNFLIKETV